MVFASKLVKDWYHVIKVVKANTDTFPVFKKLLKNCKKIFYNESNKRII